MAVEANAQALINVARYRLCVGQVSPETRRCMEDLKAAIYKSGQRELSNVMVPNCVYRCGCPEFKKCGFFDRLIGEAADDKFDMTNIQDRYELYNSWFWKSREKEETNELAGNAKE